MRTSASCSPRLSRNTVKIRPGPGGDIVGLPKFLLEDQACTRDRYGMYKGYLRDTQGIPKGTTPSQCLPNTFPTPSQYRASGGGRARCPPRAAPVRRGPMPTGFDNPPRRGGDTAPHPCPVRATPPFQEHAYFGEARELVPSL